MIWNLFREESLGSRKSVVEKSSAVGVANWILRILLNLYWSTKCSPKVPRLD